MTGLGALNYFLGIYVRHDHKSMFLSLCKYALELLKSERAHMLNYNPCKTRIDTDFKLGPESVLVSDPTLYRSLS